MLTVDEFKLSEISQHSPSDYYVIYQNQIAERSDKQEIYI